MKKMRLLLSIIPVFYLVISWGQLLSVALGWGEAGIYYIWI